MEVFGREYASIYDALYRDKDYVKECDFIEAIFRKFSSGVTTILDLGCGTGGHALLLAERGYQVVGVDHSSDMLERAREKARETGCSVEFFNGEIATVELHRSFDAVISMFAVMSYQTSNEALARACRTASTHLESGGIFIFDCWHGIAALTERPTVRMKEVKINDHERVLRFTEPILSALTHTVESRFTFFKINGSRVLFEGKESHRMRFFFPQEIAYFLKVAGFNQITLCPFLRLEEPLGERDWNMAVIAKK